MNASIPADADDSGALVRPSRRLLATLCGVVVAVAVAGYAWKGSPGLQPDPVATSRAGGDEATGRQQLESVAAQLAQRVKQMPDDADGWSMLGRSYGILGRTDEALAAYEKALSLRGDDAGTLAAYAGALAAKNGGHATPQSDAALARALAAEPTHPKALWLAGLIAYQRGDHATAIRHWETLAQALPPDSPESAGLQASLAQARRRSALAAATDSIGSANGQTDTASTNASANTSVSGTVRLSPSLEGRTSPNDTVFIFARAAQGSRMPLAVLRKQVKDLPLSFTLDDSMAMSPSARLSASPQVIVGVRISKSGDAKPSPGDWSAESTPVAPGASGVALTLGSTAGS